MKTGDKYLLALMIIGLSLVGYAHYDSRESCLSMKKPNTASTPPFAISPLTGKYKRITGQLFCYDTRGTLWALPEITK